MKILTLEDMVKWNNEICGNIVRFALHRGFPNCEIPLTQENIQDMYENRCSVHEIAKLYGLSFEIRRKPTENGYQGSIAKYVKGKSIFWIRTRFAADKTEDLVAVEGGPLGSIQRMDISWSYHHKVYTPAPHDRDIFCREEEIEIIRKLAKGYSLRLMGGFRTERSFCKECHREI